MLKKEKKTKVYELIQRLRTLDAFGIDICEAEIKINKNCLEIKNKETTAHIYDDSVHIYTHK